jgi:hypothetical protein
MHRHGTDDDGGGGGGSDDDNNNDDSDVVMYHIFSTRWLELKPFWRRNLSESCI